MFYFFLCDASSALSVVLLFVISLFPLSCTVPSTAPYRPVCLTFNPNTACDPFGPFFSTKRTVCCTILCCSREQCICVVSHHSAVSIFQLSTAQSAFSQMRLFVSISVSKYQFLCDGMCLRAVGLFFVLFFTTTAVQHSPKRVAPRFPFLCAVPSRHRPRPDSARALSKQCVHPIFDASTRRLLSLPPFLSSTDFRALQPLRGTFAATSTMTRSKMASRIHMLRAV